MKIGRLTLIAEPYLRKPKENSPCKRKYVLAQCYCGTIKEYQLINIQRKIKGEVSCGCYQDEHPAHLVHGLSKNNLIYNLWIYIKDRCYNLKSQFYKDYGGRGIRVSDEWMSDFKKFSTWALNNGWLKGLTIDRINNDGNYESTNCRFTNHAVQARNRRSTKLTQQKVNEIRLMYKSGIKNQRQIAKQYGIARGTVTGVVNYKSWAQEMPV